MTPRWSTTADPSPAYRDPAASVTCPGCGCVDACECLTDEATEAFWRSVGATHESTELWSR